MTTISCHRLEDVIKSTKTTLDRWADDQKAIADRMAAEAAEQYEEFEKRMEASRERLLALQLNRGLDLNSTTTELDQIQSEVQMKSEENDDLEVILVEKKHAIDRKFV